MTIKTNKESKLQTILECSRIGTWEWNIQTGETVFNEAWAQIVGYSLDELTPVSIKTWERLVHPDDLLESNRLLECHFSGELPYYDFESRIKHKDGHWVWVHDCGKVISWSEDGKPEWMYGSHHDVTERNRMEEHMKQYKNIFSSTSDGVALLDKDYRYLIVNEAYERFSGVKQEQFIGRKVSEYLGKDVFQQVIKPHFDKCLQGDTVKYQEWFEYTSIGRRFVEITYSPYRDVRNNICGVLSNTRDITEQKKLVDALNNAQKLESLGLLAGGIAHDFNNLMGGIFGYIDMASEQTNEAKVTSYLSKAMNTIDRARALTQQLLTFAKGGVPIQKIEHLSPFVEETAQFALSGANVSCDFNIPPDLWPCNFDKNQIGQVIDNLIINAQQAMPVGGTIKLSAQNITLSEKEHPLLENGNYVTISIKDTGIGISKEFIAKIFDPFFTTKAKGHGLGLATCYSIINRHGGCIDVESEQGKGSTFKVYLPASMEAVSSAKKKTDKTHKGSGTFLIMDDEEVMRDTIGDMLGNLGYTAVCKDNGKDAIDFLETETKANRKIAGMLFDLTVTGGIGGKAAIEEIRKINRDTPCFVASGYADDPVMKKPAEYGFTASICKPFRREELTEMLNKYMKLMK